MQTPGDRRGARGLGMNGHATVVVTLHWAQTQAHNFCAERVWSAYGRVPHTDARNKLSRKKTKKLVKVYFNGRVLEKARKVEW